MRKNDQIKGIITYIRGLSSNSYQSAVDTILNEYYKTKNKTFESPSPNGGDDKNDGWVVEDSIFYQIYSPFQPSVSFTQSIKNKFEEDLKGLCKLVFEDNKWNGKLSKFIFIVNTRDTTLPHDSERFYESCVNEIQTAYNKIFEYKVTNDDYISDLLLELNEFELERITYKLQIQGMIEVSKTGANDVISFIDKVGCNLQTQNILDQKGSDYNRISSSNKITINDLELEREHIERLMAKLSLVDDAVKYYGNDIHHLQIFENVKNLFIKTYKDLCENLSGVDLYNAILDSIISSQELKIYKLPAELTMLYIFDRCDIFKKE